jgi:hypothetical protein
MPLTQRFPQGAVIARLLLNLIETTAGGMMLAGAGDASCTDIILLCAVMIGHADGRPMTASKLAAYVGMPRPTVFRRLQELMSRGIIGHDARKRWRLLTIDMARRDLIDSVVVANAQHVFRAADALSKMDGLDVACRYPAELRPSHGDAK